MRNSQIPSSRTVGVENYPHHILATYSKSSMFKLAKKNLVDGNYPGLERLLKHEETYERFNELLRKAVEMLDLRAVELILNNDNSDNSNVNNCPKRVIIPILFDYIDKYLEKSYKMKEI